MFILTCSLYRYLEHYDDQMYMNAVMSKDILLNKITTLNRDLFPNGAYKKGPHFNQDVARALHFNYNRGHEKKLQMEEFGMWYDETE